ncbi:MAG: DNA translocase FtsK, partial [Bdellovibrionales bacterium]|nr:DNA translocase FtsK [Bdellovibrionales bacterium]
VVSLIGNLGGAIAYAALCIVFLALSLRLTLEQLGLAVRYSFLASVRACVAITYFFVVKSSRALMFAVVGAWNAFSELALGVGAFFQALVRRHPLEELEESVETRPLSSRKRGADAEAQAVVVSEEEPLVVRVERAQEARRRKRRGEDSPRRTVHPVHENNPKFEEYQSPSSDLLEKGITEFAVDEEELKRKSSLITAKLADFNVKGRVTHVHPGPVITMFEFAPAPGVKVNRISALQDDLAMSLRANSIRIIAPIPGRGTVGIEVPNSDHEVVRLRDLLESNEVLEAESLLSIPLGKSIFGRPVVEDISTMPHLLMAGATGTGKSVCINAILLSLLYRAHPSELGLILIDPKILELSIYEGIPHLRVPVVTEPRRARAVLQWAVHEMDRRYRLMQKHGVRSIDSYNALAAGEIPSEDAADGENEISENQPASGSTEQASPENGAEVDGTQLEFTEFLEPLPKIVIVIDELADLILTAGKQLEELITRLAQKARAAGIHLILATQRPSVDVITGLIKANFPARISFRVSSRIDSRTILDAGGAERLLGRGDMLFLKPGAARLTRIHGSFVTDDEVRRVTDFLRTSSSPVYDQRIIEMCERVEEEENQSSSGIDGGGDGYDALYDEALELVLQKGQASTSMVQRAFRIGYNRAARIIDMMERDGVVGPMDGAKPRKVILESGISD